MPLMNFKIVNAKNLKDGTEKDCQNMAYLFTEILIIGWRTEM